MKIKISNISQSEDANNKKVKNTKKLDVWVLVDGVVGHANQSLALARKLSDNYQIKKLEYNWTVRLPNFLLSSYPFHLKKDLLKEILSQKLPDVIISSGRRPAPLAIYLKKISKGRTKIIQIMRPNLNPKEFDLVILPQHDTYNHTLPNVVRIIGALNDIKNSLSDSRAAIKLNYPGVKNFIAVIIGGGSKAYDFTHANCMNLINSLKTISENHSLPLFISFSRRTPKHVKENFRRNFAEPNIIYDPEEKIPNPYPALIEDAEYIIITADSISMCSEAASTGKPIYIFCPKNFNLKKHKFFIQQLVDLGIAKRLEPETNFLVKYSYNILQELDKVAKIVKNSI